MGAKTKNPRIGPLTSMSDLRREAAKIYRYARREEIEIDTASKLVAMLRTIAEMIRDTDLEKRMDDLEKGDAPERSFGNFDRKIGNSHGAYDA